MNFIGSGYGGYYVEPYKYESQQWWRDVDTHLIIHKIPNGNWGIIGVLDDDNNIEPLSEAQKYVISRRGWHIDENTYDMYFGVPIKEPG